MKVKLLKKIRKDWHIKYHEVTKSVKEIHLIRKDFKYHYEINRIFPDWIFFIQCYLLLDMNKFIDSRKIRGNKRKFKQL